MRYTATVTIDGETEVTEVVPVRAGIKGYVRELVKLGIFDDLTWYPAAAITSVRFSEIEEEKPQVDADSAMAYIVGGNPEQDGEGM